MVRDRAIGLRGPVNWSRAASSTLVWGWPAPRPIFAAKPIGLPSASSFGASRPSTVKTRLSHLSLSRAPRPSRPCIGVSVMPPAAQPSRGSAAAKRKATEAAEPAPAPRKSSRPKAKATLLFPEDDEMIQTTPLDELIKRYPFEGDGYEEQVRSRARKNPFLEPHASPRVVHPPFLEPHASPRVMHPPKLSVQVPYPAAR